MIEIGLLGRVSVTVNGVTVTGEAAQRRRLALLALLCETPLRPVSRERLMLHLWPDSDTESARRLLSASLYVLRKALGQDAILAPGDQLQLNSSLVSVDAVRFEEASRGDDPEAALALYGGPFLEGLFVPGSPEYDQWLEGRRQEIARLYATVLERCAELRGGRGDLAGAVEAWRRLAAEDPYSTRRTVGLMRALAAAGDRAGALQSARVHARLLEAEFDAAPEADVLDLAEELRREHEARTQAPVPEMPAAAPAASPADSASAGLSTAPSATAPERDLPVQASRPAPLDGIAGGRRRSRVVAGGLGMLLVAGLAAAVAVPPALRYVRAAAGSPEKSDSPLRVLAVTPRGAPGGDTVADYVAYGIAESILYELGRSPELRMVSSGSSFLYRDSLIDPRELSRRLGADGIVLVSARAHGGDLRVSVELVRATDSRTPWRSQYDLDPADPGRQDGIARDIGRALQVTLLPTTAPGRAGGTTNAEAYDLQLRGRFEWGRRQPDALLRALDLFQRAAAADPDYAWAHVGLADTYTELGSYDYGVLAPDSAYPRARRAARRALALAPELAPAHAALASVAMNYEWDWDAAEAGYRRAIQLNPGYSPASEWLAYLLIARRRMPEALQLLRDAVEYNPSSALVLTDLAHYHYYARDYAQAHTYVERALATDAGFGRAYALRALLLCQTGAAQDAIPFLEQMRALQGAGDPVLVGLLGYAYALAGRAAEARGVTAWLRDLESERYVPAEYRAMIHIGLGEAEPALSLLEEALRRRSNSMIYLAAEPIADPLRGMPRFERILARIGNR
jgi:DNA-binding SARP family transcriptional activator/TolB-like protein/Tfp pilus assembly protein PilF